MCLSQREQFEAMDEACEWGCAHVHDRFQPQAETKPRQDIALQMHRVPDGVFIASDFQPPMADIDAELRDGSWSDEIKQAAALGIVLFVLLMATKLPFINWAMGWTELLAALAAAPWSR